MKPVSALELLMLIAEVVLCVFLFTWLGTQWQEEELNLRTQLSVKFNAVTQRTTDSLIRVEARKMPRPSDVRETQTFKVMVKGGEANRLLPVPDAVKPSVMIHRSVWSNGRDSLMLEDRDTTVMQVLSNVQVVLGALLPDSVLQQLKMKDTVGLRRRFTRELNADGQDFHFAFGDGKAEEQDGQIVLRGDGLNRLFTITLTGYKGYLLKKLMPQILFALALIFITAAAFLLALRSLWKERKLSQMRNSLVGNMSHELKTPVATVKVALEALTEKEVLQDEHTVHAYVDMASQELQRLEMLINATLHTSLLESGRLAMQLTNLDLKTLVSETVATVSARISRQGASISTQFDDGDFQIQGDRLHLQGVILNIIDNALKYGGAEVSIAIAGKVESSVVVLEICDNGPGIPKAYHRQVFDKFFRVPTGNVHQVKGYGLGLSYAAEVMRLHGGNICAGTSTDGGARLTLSFPVTKHEAA